MIQLSEPRPGEFVACPAWGCLCWATVVKVEHNYVTSRCMFNHVYTVSVWSGRVLRFDRPKRPVDGDEYVERFKP